MSKQKEIVLDGHTYTNERHIQFINDMLNAGYSINHYRGRNFYEGPSVTVKSEEYEDVIRATKLKGLKSDNMGKSGLVIYP